MARPHADNRCYSEGCELPNPAGDEPLSKDQILRDERQTERQAPENADPGEPAGGE